MELIMISSSKLKIMLSADDMQKYSLDADIDYADSKTRKAFQAILEEAKQKTGFDTESEKIFIQLYPSRKGGCEVYITKIDEDTDNDYAELSIKLGYDAKPTKKYTEKSAVTTTTSKRQGARERKRAYSFSSLENMIAVCHRLMFLRWKGQSSAYSGNGRFYIILKDKGNFDCSCIDRLSFITEYGDFESYDKIIKILSEYTVCLCPSGAVEKLGDLWKNKI